MKSVKFIACAISFFVLWGQLGMGFNEDRLDVKHEDVRLIADTKVSDEVATILNSFSDDGSKKYFKSFWSKSDYEVHSYFLINNLLYDVFSTCGKEANVPQDVLQDTHYNACKFIKEHLIQNKPKNLQKYIKYLISDLQNSKKYKELKLGIVDEMKCRLNLYWMSRDLYAFWLKKLNEQEALADTAATLSEAVTASRAIAKNIKDINAEFSKIFNDKSIDLNFTKAAIYNLRAMVGMLEAQKRSDMNAYITKTKGRRGTAEEMSLVTEFNVNCTKASTVELVKFHKKLIKVGGTRLDHFSRIKQRVGTTHNPIDAFLPEEKGFLTDIIESYNYRIKKSLVYLENYMNQAAKRFSKKK